MSNELKIDITKLTTEDLERIRFLFPEEVEKEFNARASYKNDMDLFVDIYYAQRILVPLIENMKSCPTKKALLDSNILETMVKVLNTADVRERDYKKVYEEKYPTVAETEKSEEPAATAPAAVETETPVEEPKEEAPAPAAAPAAAPAPFVPVSADQPTGAVSMEQIMATAAMMQQQAGK